MPETTLLRRKLFIVGSICLIAGSILYPSPHFGDPVFFTFLISFVAGVIASVLFFFCHALVIKAVDGILRAPEFESDLEAKAVVLFGIYLLGNTQGPWEIGGFVWLGFIIGITLSPTLLFNNEFPSSTANGIIKD